MELRGPTSSDVCFRYANFEPLDASLNSRIRRHWAHVSEFKFIFDLSGSFSPPNSQECLMRTLGSMFSLISLTYHKKLVES